jgi:hypothetical protein
VPRTKQKQRNSPVCEYPSGASKLLWRALHAFVTADYHPFPGIEQHIRETLNGGTLGEQLLLLKDLPDMLDQSDLDATRNLAGEIRKYLGVIEIPAHC